MAAGAFLGALTCSASAADSIRIMAPVWSGFAPLVVAQDLGFFKEQDLDVDLRWEDDRSNVMTAMLRGDIDMEVRAVSEYQGKPRTKDTPGIIIGTIDVSLGGDGVVADGSIKTVADLRGKTVGKLPVLPALLLLQYEMKKAGIGFDEVNFVDSEVADTVAVFGDTSIAAIGSSEPFISQAIKANPERNGHVLVSSKDYPGWVTDVIIVRNDDLAANPDKYRRFLIAMHKAVDVYDADPDKFIATAAPHYQLDAAAFKESITGTLDYLSFSESAELMGTPEAPGKLYEIFDAMMDLNLESDSAEEKLVAKDKIDSSIMASIKPADLE
jgi:NitT/TauT family transport system substrate-binding protein